ncbi:MAG: ATP-binding protein [Pseudomonadota bacterium]
MCLAGALIGAGLSALAFGEPAAAAGLFAIGGLSLLAIWFMYGWQVLHFDHILQAIEAMPIPIAIYDPQDRLIACNRKYAHHHPKVKGKLDLMDRRIRPSYAAIVGHALDPSMSAEEKAAATRKWTEKQPRADGRLVERRFPHIGWLRVGKRQLPAGGNVRVAIEINELKQREADLVDAIEHARRADDMKSKFFSKMTHELRTPLNGIIGMSNVVLLTDLDAKTKRNVEALRNSGFHLLDVVNRVLDFSKLSSHTHAQKSVDFDLPELIEEVLNETRFSPHAEGLSLTAQITPGTTAMWRGYRTGLRQVLTNLVGNAVKFTDHGTVCVYADQRDDTILIDVVDTGIGIPKDQQDRIFNPFEQIDFDWTQHYGGTGLGLTICAEIVDAMAGTIQVESAAGKGSRFRLELPMRPLARQTPVSKAS